MEDPLIEEIAEDVHKGWMAEKQKQGFADHPHTFVRQSNGMGIMVGACRPECDLNIEKHHADMLPYTELADNVKEYDRATARAVFQGLARRGYVVKAERDLAWIKAAVMNNRDVCEECSTEIARAVGWDKD